MALLEVDPQLRSFAGEARFAQLIERVNPPGSPGGVRSPLDVLAPEQSTFSS
jgi:hypothetical protein